VTTMRLVYHHTLNKTEVSPVEIAVQTGGNVASVTEFLPERPRRNVRPGKLEISEGDSKYISSARKQLGEILSSEGLSQLSALRLNAGMSQAELVQKAGIAQPQLSRLENGLTPNPTLDIVRRLSTALNVSIDEVSQALSMTVVRHARHQ
jgi:DNA-binding XRE family transcriptional regulator